MSESQQKQQRTETRLNCNSKYQNYQTQTKITVDCGLKIKANLEKIFNRIGDYNKNYTNRKSSQQRTIIREAKGINYLRKQDRVLNFSDIGEGVYDDREWDSGCW